VIRRATAALSLLVILAGLAAYADTVPTLTTQYVSTFQGERVSFTLRAEDADIDPAHPEAHPLRFLVLDGPAHGVLTGDLDHVRYLEPHWAVVDLTYVPSASFVGTDALTVAVLDPAGEIGRVVSTVEIIVQKKPVLGSLSGNWEVSMSLDVQSASLTFFRTKLTEVYRLGAFLAQGIADWKYDTASPTGFVFDALRFEARLPLMPFAQVASTLAFDPNSSGGSGPFDYWRWVTRVAASGASATHTLYLKGGGSGSYQTLVVNASVGDVSLTSTTWLDLIDCAFCFRRETIQATWTWSALPMRASLSLADNGFEAWSIRLADVPIPGLSGPDLGLYLTTEVQFTPTQKRLLPSLELQSPWVDCLQVLMSLETSGPLGTTVDGVCIYGLRMRCAFPGGIDFQTATSFDPARNTTLTGHSDYFELIALSGPTRPCCRAPGLWRFATYFTNASEKLFDWGMTKFSLDIGVGEQLRTSAEVVVRSGSFPGDRILELTVGFVFRW